MKLAIVLAVSFGVVTYLNSEFANQALLWSFSGFVGYIILLKLTGAVGKRELSGIKYLFRRENNEKTELL
tara:strand:- start:665 stop:874 length:210 start_codon:yes stop_codon:yes gene_type:complete